MEHFFICPYCWQTVSVILDLSVGTQTYIEDCEVCCNPIEIGCTAEDGEVIRFNAARVLE